jgi:hypothetical protein
MTAKEFITRFKETDEEYYFEIFREFDLEDFGLDWVGEHEYLDCTTDDEGEEYHREFTTVRFIDHNFIIQEIKTYEDSELISTKYFTAVPKEIVQIIYNADEEII